MPRSIARASSPFPLERGERLIYVAYRHWIALARRGALPFILWAIVSLLFLLRLLSGRLDQTALLLLALGVSFFLIQAYIYFDWINDILYVTSKRVIFVDRVLLFSSKRDELVIDSIENVNIETETIIARQLGYGDVVVQTASRVRNIRFKTAARPEEIQRKIMDEVRPIRSGLAQDRVRQVVRARVLHGKETLPQPAPAHLLPPSFFGRGFTFIFPPNPRRDGDSIVWHKHWIVAVSSLLDPVLLLAILLVGRIVLLQLGLIGGAISTAIFFGALLATVGWMVYRWVDWLDDLYILSPDDVVDIERHPLGKEDRKQASLAAIQNVTSDQPNLLARILNYGSVFLQTAGGEGQFSFDQVPDPDKVQAVVFDYLDNFRHRQQEKERFAVLDLIRQYHLLEGDETGERQIR